MIDRIKMGEKVDRAEEVFRNVGRCASDIMDLIAHYAGEREECVCFEEEIKPIHMLHGLWDS